MPTNTNAYNSRVTDEALEKRFRDTFRAQGGAELVDDLYAQGVIVPIVDFTQAATGEVLAQNLQTAWDFTTGYTTFETTSYVTAISNAGFWNVRLNMNYYNTGANDYADVSIYDGTTYKPVWGYESNAIGTATATSVAHDTFVVFLRSGDSLVGRTSGGDVVVEAFYRQIATVTGDLVNPSGFTSS